MQYMTHVIFQFKLSNFTVLSLDDCTGNFDVGKDFDALRVNVCVPGSPIDLFPGDDPEV